MTKSNTCLFATVLCLIPENVYGRPLKKQEMDWHLVASYFTVTSTDIFAVYSPHRKKKPNQTGIRF